MLQSLLIVLTKHCCTFTGHLAITHGCKPAGIANLLIWPDFVPPICLLLLRLRQLWKTPYYGRGNRLNIVTYGRNPSRIADFIYPTHPLVGSVSECEHDHPLHADNDIHDSKISRRSTPPDLTTGFLCLDSRSMVLNTQTDRHRVEHIASTETLRGIDLQHGRPPSLCGHNRCRAFYMQTDFFARLEISKMYE